MPVAISLVRIARGGCPANESWKIMRKKETRFVEKFMTYLSFFKSMCYNILSEKEGER